MMCWIFIKFSSLNFVFLAHPYSYRVRNHYLKTALSSEYSSVEFVHMHWPYLEIVQGIIISQSLSVLCSCKMNM